jgi:hypothetical protein
MASKKLPKSVLKNLVAQMHQARREEFESDAVKEELQRLEDIVNAAREVWQATHTDDSLQVLNAAIETRQAFFNQHRPDRSVVELAERARHRRRKRKAKTHYVVSGSHEHESRLEQEELFGAQTMKGVVLTYDGFDNRAAATPVPVVWGDSFKPGSLVRTRTGELGIVVDDLDAQAISSKPAHIEDAMVTSYIQLLIGGTVKWFKKSQVRAAD